MNIGEYHRAVELSAIRLHMKYGQAQFEEDWAVSVAVAQLLAMGSHPDLERVLDGCFKRLTAYVSNNPDARPF